VFFECEGGTGWKEFVVVCVLERAEYGLDSYFSGTVTTKEANGIVSVYLVGELVDGGHVWSFVSGGLVGRMDEGELGFEAEHLEDVAGGPRFAGGGVVERSIGEFDFDGIGVSIV
jgi:hypothetical protein